MTRLRGDTHEGDPYSTMRGQVPNGYRWTRNVARGPRGCQIAEQWAVHEMGHYWSGGSTDPRYSDPATGATQGGFNDPRGPSASQLSWAFFKQFSLKRGNAACRPR